MSKKLKLVLVLTLVALAYFVFAGDKEPVTVE
jgi:hypothetical protein